MLAEERTRLHPVPAFPHTVAFGLARTVPARTPMVALDHAQYSVPHQLMGQQVWVRVHGQGSDEKVIAVHTGSAGPIEPPVMSATPGSPKVVDAHFPPQPGGGWTGSRRRKTLRRLSSWPSAAAPGCG